MNDQETIARFIFLRSQGWSFNRIALELQVSKPTLIKWSRQHQFEIQNLRATETEVLAERVFGERHQRWETLAKQLKKLGGELNRATSRKSPLSRCTASPPGCVRRSLARSVARNSPIPPRIFPAKNS
jgi:transposase-like protein